MLRRLFLALSLLLFVTSALAGPPASGEFEFYPGGRYNPSIPTPASVLGYRVGEAFTPHAEVERYYKTLAQAAGERMRLLPYGKTFEGRTLYLAVFSAPENLARPGGLESIRANIARLSNPRKTSLDQATEIARTTPAIAWLSYNVHGNESSSSEASLQVAYQLAAGEDERTLKILKECVVILDPMVNPDGRDRYVQFYRSVLGRMPNPNPEAAEHNERWPSGRTNHYYFDLNRDWAWQSQPESQARVAEYRRWNPQLHVDYHEMNLEATYYFAPPAQPILESIDPLLTKWFRIYAKGNAAAFDRFGIRYYTSEDFDLFYPSYGDSWPSLNGAIGMTYEQAGGGRGGLVARLREGQGEVTLRDRAWHHFTTSLATLETTANHREARLLDFYEFHRAALRAGSEGPIHEIYLLAGKDPARSAQLIDRLLRQGIEVQQASEPLAANDVRDYAGSVLGDKRFPAATYVVDLAQPKGFLARALLEPESKLRGLLFYDVTGWSLPLASGVEAYWSQKKASGERRAVTVAPEAAGGVSGPDHATAYLFTWDTNGAAALLAALLERDVRCYVAIAGFKLAGQAFDPGTIIVPRETNLPDLDQKMKELSAQAKVDVMAASSGLADAGIDLGSNRMRFVRKPKVAIVMDRPVAETDYGALWFLFDQQLGMPFTAIAAEDLRGVELADYNVLIFPSDFGTGRGWSRYVDKKLAEKIGGWIRNGGVVVGMRGGAVLATKNKAGWSSIGFRYVRERDEQERLEEEKEAQAAAAPRPALAGAPPPPPAEKPPEKDKAEQAAKELEKKLLPWSKKEIEERKEEIPGTIMRLNLDNTHPLGFGYAGQVDVLNRTSPILELTAKGDNVIYYPKENFKLSGYLTEDNARKLANTAYLVREQVGRGFVILYADSPVFRGFWEGTVRLFMNSVFFGNIANPYFRQ